MRYNKAGTLDGEVNLELPDVEEVEVEVREGRGCLCGCRAAATAAVMVAVTATRKPAAHCTSPL